MLQLLTLQNGLRTTGSANNPKYNILERWWFGSIGRKKEYYCLVVIRSQEIQLRWRLNTPNDYLSWPIENALLGIGSSIRLATERYSKVVSKIRGLSLTMFYPCTGFQHIRHEKNMLSPERCTVFFPRLRVAGRLRLVLPFPAARLASQWRRRRPRAHFVVGSIGLPVATKVGFLLKPYNYPLDYPSLHFFCHYPYHPIPMYSKIIYLHLDIHGQKGQRYMDAMC